MGDRVKVGVRVGIGIKVRVRVGVRVGIGVRVRDWIGDRVGAIVGIRVGVAVRMGIFRLVQPPISPTNCTLVQCPIRVTVRVRGSRTNAYFVRPMPCSH